MVLLYLSTYHIKTEFSNQTNPSMKKLKYLLLFLLSLSFACSSEDENPKLVEKDVTIEVEMDGSYHDYLVTFSVHSMLSGTSTFVAPVLDQPTDLDWTQVVEQGNTYTLSFEPDDPKISASSSAPIHSLGFVFNAVHLGGNPDEHYKLLSAAVRVFVDGNIYRKFYFVAMGPGRTSASLAEEMTFQ
jgi:hypothetical protein